MTPRDAVPREGLVAANRNRRNIYGFLSRMYEKEISVDFLKELSSRDSPIFQIGNSEGLDEGVRKGFGLMSRYLSAGGRSPNDVWVELAAEYASLFLALRKKPAHPSESAYMNESHYKFQDARDQVFKIYMSANVDKVKEFTEPEDHIAVELQFMEYLCRKTIEALERDERAEAKKYLQTQREFVDNHLAKWVPQFTQDVLDCAEVDFYKGVAYFTRSFIESERETIPSLIEDEVLSPGS